MAEIAPATLEGWYVLHQVFRIDWPSLAVADAAQRAASAATLQRAVARFHEPATGGWSVALALVGGGADVMFVHFRPTLDDLARVQQELRRCCGGSMLRLHSDFTSVTETALYGASAEAALGAVPGTPEHQRRLDELVAAERSGPRMEQRLYPRVPADMRYACFYSMSKRRAHPDNWYALPLAERDRLMKEHGLTGRRYAGRIVQVISGAAGLDDWEWGVTLFARDPLEFKRVVTEMRYDEASARYAEFGEFYTGIRIEPGDWPALLGVTG